jgi:hypothetical protein
VDAKKEAYARERRGEGEEAALEEEEHVDDDASRRAAASRAAEARWGFIVSLCEGD